MVGGTQSAMACRLAAGNDKLFEPKRPLDSIEGRRHISFGDPLISQRTTGR
jgi:hypothetical protein